MSRQKTLRHSTAQPTVFTDYRHRSTIHGRATGPCRGCGAPREWGRCPICSRRSSERKSRETGGLAGWSGRLPRSATQLKTGAVLHTAIAGFDSLADYQTALVVQLNKTFPS
jgi:hypothetical protein